MPSPSPLPLPFGFSVLCFYFALIEKLHTQKSIGKIINSRVIIMCMLSVVIVNLICKLVESKHKFWHQTETKHHCSLLHAWMCSTQAWNRWKWMIFFHLTKLNKINHKWMNSSIPLFRPFSHCVSWSLLSLFIGLNKLNKKNRNDLSMCSCFHAKYYAVWFIWVAVGLY